MTGSVEKTIPRAWKFAKENFVIRNSPSIEVYSAGDRLNKKYRMKLWIPITDVLPNFKKNTSFMGNLRRKVSDSVENVIEFSKTDTGKKVFVVGGTVFYHLSSLSRHLTKNILSSVVKIRKLFYFGLKFSVKKCIQKQHLMLKFFDKVLQ